MTGKLSKAQKKMLGEITSECAETPEVSWSGSRTLFILMRLGYLEGRCVEEIRTRTMSYNFGRKKRYITYTATFWYVRLREI